MQKFLGFIGLFLLLPNITSQAQKEGGYTIRSTYATIETCDYRTSGIFIAWWDKKFDYSVQAEELLTTLTEVQNDCINTYYMQDPPNPVAGYYYNVYIHNGANDLFPNGWAMGQGTDENGHPFLTIPIGYAHLNNSGLQHEGFHIFQYRSNSPGFAYRGDSQWYIEATANWYAATKHPDSKEEYITASAVTANPQVPMWYSFSNWEPGDPENWQRYCHQYGMNIFLNYLTDVREISPEIIVGGFYAQTNELPQEYLYKQIGPSQFCDLYADFAAHNVGGYEFFPAGTAARALQELNNYGDLSDIHDIVETYTNGGTEDKWYQPTAEFETRAWGYNVYKINNSLPGYYSFKLQGDSLGSLGAPAEFQGRIVVKSIRSVDYQEITMSTHTYGEGTILVKSSDKEIYFIVVATPVCFSGNQHFPYQINIERSSNDGMDLNPVSPFLDQNFPNPFNSKTEIGYTLGQASEVTLNITDLHGKFVIKIKEGLKEAGYHHLTLPASGLPAGIYFYTLKAGNFIQTRQMVKVE